MFVQKTSLMWSGGKTLRVITLLDVNLHKVIRFFAHWVSFFKKKAQFVSADAFSEKYLGKYYAPIEFLYHDSNEHFESKVSKYTLAPNEGRNNWCHSRLRDFDFETFETFLDFETKKQVVPWHQWHHLVRRHWKCLMIFCLHSWLLVNK